MNRMRRSATNSRRNRAVRIHVRPDRAGISAPGLDNPARRWHQSGTSFSNRPSPMKQFLLKFFTWWNGQTFGTQLWTWRFGELVGQDEQGNTYYRTKGRKIDPTLGFERRWVIYNGYAEATRVPPSWHGWLHHTVDVAPDRRELHAARVGKAARPEHDRHARGLSSLRLDARKRPPPQGDRRLPALDARKLRSSSSLCGRDAAATRCMSLRIRHHLPVNNGISGDIRRRRLARSA